MSELYPLLLLPEFHERVWGTKDLSAFYPAHKVGNKPIGEVWLTGEHCRVGNGPLSGKMVVEVAERFGAALTGSAAKISNRFPLLIKIIFPLDKLSVQVHPDDEAAQDAGFACGKTECWYVLHATPGARIGLGLRPGTSQAHVKHAINNRTMEQLLNWIEVAPGDLYYVDAGTVHAIGPGCILLETQQNSDTTYRLYDYGRPRELHIEQGLTAMKERTRAGKVRSMGGNGRVVLVSSPCFRVEKALLKQEKSFSTSDESLSSVHCLVGIRGCGVVESDGNPAVSLGRGEAVVVPAAVRHYRVRPQWEFEFVWVALPTTAVAEPETVPAHELQPARATSI
jgi:mannose-6-phosphate isomerase